MVSTVLFTVADSVAWLFVARGLQGLATGAALSAASAALLDLHPRRDPAQRRADERRRVGRRARSRHSRLVVARPAGIGAACAARTSCCSALFAVAFAGAYWMPEPVERRRRFRLTLERPSVPAVARRPFLLAALAVLSSWSIGGLFFSLGPQLSAHLFDDDERHRLGHRHRRPRRVGSDLPARCSARSAPWIGAGAGSIALAAGMVTIVDRGGHRLERGVSSPGRSSAASASGSPSSAGCAALVAAIPPEHRAAVMSAFYIVAYASLSVPAVLAGLVVTHLGLQTTFEIFGSVVAGIALVVALEAWRSRPARRRLELVAVEARRAEA